MKRRTDHVEDARDFEDRQRYAAATGKNRTDSHGKHVTLDERHAAEQNAIGEGARFAPGDYLVEIVRCYAVAGAEEIWLPEKDVTYFVAECDAFGERDPAHGPERASWVNRLRFNGFAQLKGFLAEAMAKQVHEITEALCLEVTGAGNPLAGVRMQLRVQEPKGGPGGYQHHQWRRAR